MSTGSAVCRGALFALLVVHPAAGTSFAESAAGGDASRFRLKWLADLGAESIAAGRGAGSENPSSFVAAVPGAAYFLRVGKNGALERRRRMAATFAVPYGVASSSDAALVIGNDGSVSFWPAPHRGKSRLGWRKELGERATSVGWDGGGSVWVATRDDRLLSLAASDGEEIWSLDIGGMAEGPPVRDGKSLFVATKRNALFRIDAGNGKALWKAELPGPAHHPPVLAGADPRLVICGTWDGHLVAFDASSAESLWSIDLSSRLAGAPVAGADFVAAVTSDGSVHAYGLSGERRWVSPASRGASDLVLDGSRLVVVSSVLHALDGATGETLDTYPEGAVQEVERRFLDARIEGEKVYSESEKAGILAREAFPIRGRLFGEARLTDESLVFATEDGWIYLFDMASIRPRARYRAGQRAGAPPLVNGEILLAAAGEALYALGRDSGRTLWRRDLGLVRQLAAGTTIGVVGDDRFSTIDPETGARRWSVRGDFYAAFPISETGSSAGDAVWMAVERHGSIHAFDAAGGPVGSTASAGAEIASVTRLEDGVWAIATREGRVSAFAWSGTWHRSWTSLLEGAVRDMSVAGPTLLIRQETSLLGLAAIDGSELWKLPLTAHEAYQAVDAGTVAVFGDESLRLADAVTGELREERTLRSQAVGAALRDGALLWLDRSGRAHRVELGEKTEAQSVDLAERLAAAVSVDGGFLVTTAAGEIGFVELVDPPALAIVEKGE